MQIERKTAVPLCVALVIGVALWIAASLATGKREPWDASVYWTVAYPLALVASAGLGFVFHDRPWRWGLALFEGQFVGMVIRNGELGGLWPLGMALFAIIALPAIGAAHVAASLSTTRVASRQ
ncbi:MAG: hypothetical protein QM736_21830 [Vicinamibacterales bacterium]